METLIKGCANKTNKIWILLKINNSNDIQYLHQEIQLIEIAQSQQA
jgi:hypothetical protein